MAEQEGCIVELPKAVEDHHLGGSIAPPGPTLELPLKF